MRRLADASRLQAFMCALGREAREEGRVYFAGGATAVLLGWRPATIDADIRLVPDSDRLLRAIPALKDSLELNVELASPADFIPELPGWEDRSLFIVREGKISFHHYDFYSQVLAKVERRHEQDLADIASMLREGRVEPRRALEFFYAIEPQFYRFPEIDPGSFRRAAEEAFRVKGR